jgi:antitoxin component of MazEF toxin-antitoxin module
MATTSITNFHSRVLPWGNGLGLRITKTLAAAAGVEANSELNITVEQGRIVIDVKPQNCQNHNSQICCSNSIRSAMAAS